MARSKTKPTPKRAAKAKTKPKAKPAPKKTATKKAPKPVPADVDPEELMWKAVQKLDGDAIMAAVAAGASLHGALHSVVGAENKLSPKDVARAKLLLDLGANPAWVDDTEEHGWSTLIELALSPNQDAALEVLEAMLAKDATLSAAPDRLNRTPLHVAVWYGKHAPFWDKLVALGNPIASVDNGGSTPMFDAISHGNRKAIQWLVDQGASLDGSLAFARDPANYCSPKDVAFLEKLGATS